MLAKSLLIQIIGLFMPWALRRRWLKLVLRYEIHPSAMLGVSLICSRTLKMGAGARIGHLTFARHMDAIHLGESASLGNLNWINGASGREAFKASIGNSKLIIERHAAVTHRHLIDCSETVHVAEFATIAGWGTQIISHGIDLASGVQDARPVRVGAYSFVGSRSILLKGCVLPSYSVLSAGSVLGSKFAEPYYIYSGVPAVLAKKLSPDFAYFVRKTGRVH